MLFTLYKSVSNHLMLYEIAHTVAIYSGGLNMSQSQNSDCDDYDDDDDDYDTYYQDDDDMDQCSIDAFTSCSEQDLEQFTFQTLNPEDVERLFNEDVAKLQSSLHVSALIYCTIYISSHRYMYPIFCIFLDSAIACQTPSTQTQLAC